MISYQYASVDGHKPTDNASLPLVPSETDFPKTPWNFRKEGR